MHLDLLPPLVEAGHVNAFIKSGMTISASISPANSSLSVFVTPSKTPAVDHKSHFVQEHPLYFAATNAPPSSERRLFVSDTLLIFEAFQNLFKRHTGTRKESRHAEPGLLPVMRKLSIDYVNFIKECWIHASQPVPRPDGPLQFSSDHYRSLYSCFSLFVLLFLPESGFEEAPVGEELMEWLNIHFIEPSTEEGDQLSSLDCPWEDDNFWSYLTRATLRGLTKASVFFLKTLVHHPSEDLQELTHALIPLVDDQPRLQNFSTERDFLAASRRWREKVKNLRINMDGVPVAARSDTFGEWWSRLSDIVGILEGRGEVLLRVCGELGSDWKEVCCAWGVFVDHRLRRKDISDLAAKIIYDMPPDPTDLEDLIHANLMSEDFESAIEQAFNLDPWLAAHLADIMERLGVLSSESDDSQVSKRDHYILSYAEYLHSDPNLWRVTLSYMYSCGLVGTERGDEVLVRVTLKLHEQREQAATGEQVVPEGLTGTLKEVNEMCFQYKREAARRTICRIAAQTFLHEKDYAQAVTYCTSAEDWNGLGGVADRLLEEYVAGGAVPFARSASGLGPLLQSLRNNERTNLHSASVHRLMFAVRYAQFHQFLLRQEWQDAAADLISMFKDDIAPRSWWAVLLRDSVCLLRHESTLLFSTSDTFIILQRLEEIFLRSGQGCSNDYLVVLSKTIQRGGAKEALNYLKTVRLTLARYIARCAVVGSEKVSH